MMAGRRRCRRYGEHERPCSCEMGNIYRFAEPIILLALAKLGQAHGYQVAQAAEQMAVTHAGLDSAVVYRSLRRLEETGHVSSSWDTSGSGPARRMYVLTPAGWEHLREWGTVLEEVSGSLQALARDCQAAGAAEPAKAR